MRKLNVILGALLLVLLIVHVVGGSFQLLGVLPGGKFSLQLAACVLAALCVLHALIGLKLTWESLRAVRQSGVFYFRGNKTFLASRLSGLALLLLIVTHVHQFWVSGGGPYRLHDFGVPQLMLQLLLVLALLVHVLANVRVALIGLGLGRLREYVPDALFVAAVLLLVAAGAVVAYYVRWNLT